MSDSNDSIEFATVFRHELAAITDRRRVQRMEALRQLGADGDYSRTARQWAVDAADEECLLAEQASESVDRLHDVIRPFLKEPIVVTEVRDMFQRLSEPAKLTATDSQSPKAEADSPSGGRSTHSRLQQAAADAAHALTDLSGSTPVSQPSDGETSSTNATPADAIREALNHIYRMLVIRELKVDSVNGETATATDAGGIKILITAKQQAEDAFQKALKQRDVVRRLGEQIRTAAAFNAAAELASKVLATASLFDNDQVVNQYEVFVSGAAATAAILRACHAAKKSQAARLLANGRQAAEKMTEVFRAVTRDCLPGLLDRSLSDRARKTLRGMLETALEIPDPPVENRQDILLQADSWSLEQLTEETMSYLEGAITSLGGKLRPVQQVTDPLTLLREVGTLSRQCCVDAYRLLPGPEAAKLREESPNPEVELDANRAKQIATEAVQDLGKAAIVVAEWAWAAETQAALAIREATAILTKRFRDHPPAPGTGRRSASPPALPKPDLEHLRTHALDRGLVGLAFSGGGIRSATFGLGVLQALGQLQLLRFFDYHSTVSGGGYIGSWLAAWIHREHSLVNVEKQLDPSRVQQATATRVVKIREDSPQRLAYPLRAGTLDDEPEPVQHLRAYSRYLAPRLFSADTWTLVAIYLRNLVVNIVSLVPWVFTVLLVSRLIVWGFTRGSRSDDDAPAIVVTVFGALSLGGLVVWGYQQRARLRESFRDPLSHSHGADRMEWPAGILLIAAVVLLTTTSLWLFSYSPPNGTDSERMSESDWKQAQLGSSTVASLGAPDGQGPLLSATAPYPERPNFLRLRHPAYAWLNGRSFIWAWHAGLKFTFLFGAGALGASTVCGLQRYWRRLKYFWKLFGLLLIADTILGLGLGFFVYMALVLVIWPAGTDAAAVVTFGFPALLTAVVLADYLEMILVGSFLDDSEREWRSRIGAFLFMIALGWLAFFCTTLYLPWAVQQACKPEHRPLVFSLATGIWATLSGLAAWAGRWLQGKSTSGWSIPWLRLVAALGPPIFLIGLLAFGAMLTFLIAPGKSDNYLDIACSSSLCSGSLLFRWLVLGVIGIAAVWNLVRVNLFSLHMLYANRLIRCYLGASRRKLNWNRRAAGPVRRSTGGLWWLWGVGTRGAPTNANVPDPSTAPGGQIARREPTFTDFDPADDLCLHKLQTVAPVPAAVVPVPAAVVAPVALPAVAPVAPAAAVPVRPDQGYRGPYPLINTALNLVGSPDLAIQDRRAASFVLTPDFCGSPICGYARNRGDYLTLGRAMTISGAAVDPNMGVYYSPQLTALMTILNTRLGWWLQNPERWREEWDGAGPGADPLLLMELFGQTDETSRYVHLSDGGHFENLGVYELIRRRCRYIVVTDVTDDRHASTDNLANLIRLVRTDFGVGIQMDTEQLVEGPDGRTRWHCAIGLIHYEDIDPQALSGILVYLYSSLTGDEPPDIQQYAQVNAAFPHETTLDQFFSEAQFESYRALGYHIAMEVFGSAARAMNRNCCSPNTAQEEVRKFFSAVRKRWFPPPPDVEQQFLPAANLYLNTEEKLRGAMLQGLRQELYPEVPDGVLPPPAPRSGAATATSELLMVSEMLQVMQMVWFGMKLDSYHSHSLNRGWMNLFRRWTTAPTFHRHWPFLRGEFSQDFVRFCEQALNLTPTDIVAQRMQGLPQPSWLADFRAMDLEFEQEWASEKERLNWLTTGRYVIDAVAVARQFQVTRRLTHPLVWRLALRDDLGAVMERCSGVLCVGPPYGGAGRDLELFFWLRGAYRNFGIGRTCFPRILADIIEELGRIPFQGGQRDRLLTYYPDSSLDKADRLAKAEWMNFFFDHKFRSVPTGAPGAIPGVITLARELD